jgi:hypothetical protein
VRLRKCRRSKKKRNKAADTQTSAMEIEKENPLPEETLERRKPSWHK